MFHLASPCIVDQVHDPERELLDPAIKGTVNVLTAAKELGVKRVVVTSSISAIIPSRYWPADVVKGDDCWTDIDYCKQNGVRTAFILFDMNFLLCIVFSLFLYIPMRQCPIMKLVILAV